MINVILIIVGFLFLLGMMVQNSDRIERLELARKHLEQDLMVVRQDLANLRKELKRQFPFNEDSGQ